MCEFCGDDRDGLYSNDYIACGVTDVWIYRDYLFVETFLDPMTGESTSVSYVKVNYCPMCGKEL